ncbi:hypothetical protein KIH74_25165 [Kineosporia sp. J2-2]|uniref:Lipoprotein n=1 Tax=Kineosporia corallincola TaxID=2835133 RepID=A0ABS5TMD3_9ACTN|nr:hypothetical protein [Kineosporia corallincola]MBT0772260.1 hypothetical protein [Kineosporia corallincola]
MRRRAGVIFAVVTAVAVSGAALVGCGSDNPYELPEYRAGQDPGSSGGGSVDAASESSGDATSTPAPSGSGPIPTVSREASPPSTDVTYTPADAQGQGAWVERGKIRARNQKAKAAVDAVVGYVAQRVRLSNTWTVDEDALAAVAQGQALTSARERAETQEAAGRRSVGRFVVNVSSVKVNGDVATVTGCHFDSTSEVDQNGYVLVPPPGGVLITMEVKLSQGVWRVTSWPAEDVPTCSAAKK